MLVARGTTCPSAGTRVGQWLKHHIAHRATYNHVGAPFGPIQTCSPYFATTALPHWLLQLWPIPPREYDPFNVKGSSVSLLPLLRSKAFFRRFYNRKTCGSLVNRPTLKTIVFYRRNVCFGPMHSSRR